MKSYEKQTLKHCLNDDEFKKVYLKKYGNLDGFEEALKNTLEYCFNDAYFNPFLEKPYLDICWLKFKNLNKYINLDDIYECFYLDVNES